MTDLDDVMTEEEIRADADRIVARMAADGGWSTTHLDGNRDRHPARDLLLDEGRIVRDTYHGIEIFRLPETRVGA